VLRTETAKAAGRSTCPATHFRGLSIMQRLAANGECGGPAAISCRYYKGAGTCAEPGHIDVCPLPRHPLRNGRLKQMAYSLFLFIRDVADNDFVGL
jgi:hypothetical protein